MLKGVRSAERMMARRMVELVMRKGVSGGDGGWKRTTLTLYPGLIVITTDVLRMLLAPSIIHPMASQTLDISIWQVISRTLISLRPHTIYPVAVAIPLASLSGPLRKVLGCYVGLVL
jgi:hypothetical protein